MRVLIACEFSGVVREAFRELGHDAFSCDVIDSEKPSVFHLKDDVKNIINDGWDLMIAHPPCTYLCVTGNKWFNAEYKDRFPNREQDRKNAIEFFNLFANSNIPRICIENPIGIMSRLWRKPDQIIQPYQFGHKEPKKTCLWLKNLPKLQPTQIVEPEYTITKSGKRVPTWFFMPSPSDKRAKDRDRTFQGIADAMASQWGSLELLVNQMENKS